MVSENFKQILSTIAGPSLEMNFRVALSIHNPQSVPSKNDCMTVEKTKNLLYSKHYDHLVVPSDEDVNRLVNCISIIMIIKPTFG